MDNNKKTPEPVAAGPGADAVASQNPTNSIAQTDDKRKALPSYYLVIPAPVAFDSELKPNAKLLYGMISALTRTEGYCWATNAYLAELTGLTEGNIGRLITQLEERGHIAREIARDEETNAVTGRKIWLCQPGGTSVDPPCKNADPSLQKCGDPPGKKAGKNIILDNNIPPISPKGDGTPEAKKGGRRKPKQTGAEAWAVLGEWSRGKSRRVRDRLVSFIDACRDHNPKSGANPLTAPAAKMLVNKLDRLSHGNEAVMVAMLDEAIEHNWQTVYEHDRGNASSVGAVPNAPAEELMGGFWDD